MGHAAVHPRIVRGAAVATRVLKVPLKELRPGAAEVLTEPDLPEIRPAIAVEQVPEGQLLAHVIVAEDHGTVPVDGRMISELLARVLRRPINPAQTMIQTVP